MQHRLSRVTRRTSSSPDPNPAQLYAQGQDAKVVCSLLSAKALLVSTSLQPHVCPQVMPRSHLHGGHCPLFPGHFFLVPAHVIFSCSRRCAQLWASWRRSPAEGMGRGKVSCMCPPPQHTNTPPRSNPVLAPRMELLSCVCI